MRRRAAALATLAAAVTLALIPGAAPAQQPPGPPQIFTFDAHPQAGVTFPAISDCESVRVATGGVDGGAYLRTRCGRLSRPRAVFTERRALVELFVRVSEPTLQRPGSLTITACREEGCDGSDVAQAAFDPAPAGQWLTVVLRDPAASIRTIEVDSEWNVVDLDDIGVSSTLPQPDTAITAGPPAATTATSATFAFSASNDPAATFACTLDGVARACPAPTLSGLGVGPHVLTVAARDRWGLVDETPASYAWTVQPSVPDRDADGVADAADNCADAANADQSDEDEDGIGDACELFASGDDPPVAGVSAVVRHLSGEVFVKLPSTVAAAGLGRALFQDDGFVSLKGIASIPVGSTVDTRKGAVAVTSAGDGRAVDNVRRRLQTATFAAGLFRLKQQRARAARAKRIPTDAVLASGEGAERVCSRGRRANRARRIVRSLSIKGKGLFRAVAGATVGVARNATWITTDRCGGTLTEVGRGRVKVRRRGKRRAVTVRAGRAYFVRETLFGVRKGRRNP